MFNSARIPWQILNDKVNKSDYMNTTFVLANEQVCYTACLTCLKVAWFDLLALLCMCATCTSKKVLN